MLSSTQARRATSDRLGPVAWKDLGIKAERSGKALPRAAQGVAKGDMATKKLIKLLQCTG